MAMVGLILLGIFAASLFGGACVMFGGSRAAIPDPNEQEAE